MRRWFYVKDLELRSFWVTCVGPKSKRHKRVGGGELTRRHREGHVKMRPQAKGRREPPEAGRVREDAPQSP